MGLSTKAAVLCVFLVLLLEFFPLCLRAPSKIWREKTDSTLSTIFSSNFLQNETTSTSVSRSSQCAWIFAAYHASKFEVEWSNNIVVNQENVCSQLQTKYKGFVDEYLTASSMLTPDSANSNLKNTKCADSDHPRTLSNNTFSAFEYEWRCQVQDSAPDSRSKFIFIEPLAGLLRHPLSCKTNLVRKDYMAVDGWGVHKAGRNIQNRQYFYFDVGASTFNTGAGGASQNWFRSIYKDLCVSFDHYYAWEAAKLDPARVFAEIPDDVTPHYHWFNIPAQIGIGHKDNPLTLMLSETTPEDFVVFKLDLDNYEVEEALVGQILESPLLSSRIDEMFWEHHVNFQPMVRAWGAATNMKKKMNYSLSLFGALRRKGIRVHSWV